MNTNYIIMDCAQKLNFDNCDRDSAWNSTALSVESSGCDLSDSFNSSSECLSPSLNEVAARKLVFSADMSTDFSPIDKGSAPAPFSPPYRRVRALRLFDSPATPKTILEKCSTPAPRIRLFGQNTPSTITTTVEKPRAIASAFKNDRPIANINPFTPNGMLLHSKKRTRSKRSFHGSPTLSCAPSFDLSGAEQSEEEDIEQPTKRVALQESNISRYHEEFLELGLLGSGEFGSVYRCLNRLDGCVYAVKKSIKPVAGSINEKATLNEVYAHAVLGKHQHVVRYYSAWAEDNHMIIQNEYCNGGSLQDLISERTLTEPELKTLLLHTAEGLRYIHSMQLVHMDVKPGNIFIAKEQRLLPLNYESADDGFEELEDGVGEEVTYKIGDLGHVTSLNNPQVEEGDCRYLPTEILRENFAHLTKADIFALGLTIFEAGGGGPLPKNGAQWHEIREAKIPELSHCSKDFNDLIKQMIHPNPEHRPSAVTIIQHRVLCPFGNKTKAQLRRELNTEKLKNEFLARQLKEATKCIQSFAPNMLSESSSTGKIKNKNHKSNKFSKQETNSNRLLRSSGVFKPSSTSDRFIGKKVNRSHSTTNF